MKEVDKMLNVTLALALFKEVYMQNLKVVNVDINNSTVTIELFENEFNYSYEGSEE